MTDQSPLAPHSIRSNTISSISFSGKPISAKYFFPKIVRFINKFLYNIPIFGIGASIDRYSNTLSFYSSNQDKINYSKYNNKSLFINLGCGGFSHKKWINYDLPGKTEYFKKILGKPNIDFYPLDLCDENSKINQDDNTVDLVYISHVIDHLDKKSISRTLRDIYRVLKPGGILRIVLPFTDRFLENCKLVEKQEQVPIEQKLISTCLTIKHSLSDAQKIKDEKLFEIAVASNYKFEDIEKYLANSIDTLYKFEPNSPYRRLAYFNHQIMLAYSESAGFRACFPLLKGHSFAKPFLNPHVFDVTEPQMSMYFELLK